MSTFLRTILPIIMSAILLAASSCGDDTETSVRSTAYDAPTETAATTATVTETDEPAGIIVDPNKQSSSGIPNPEDMKALIGLQSAVPYPVVVPTWLPADGYQLERELMGTRGPSANDPVGYYSFRYADPGNPNRTLTFNQSRANSQPLTGYYVTDVTINNTPFQVYWHKTLEYLPNDAPVPAATVGEAETYVIVWRGQYVDSQGQPQDLYYSITSGTWTGHGWGAMQQLLEGLRGLEQVG